MSSLAVSEILKCAGISTAAPGSTNTSRTSQADLTGAEEGGGARTSSY
jgi:hypothetical protein